ncbi:MAG: hypothetical protein IJF92_05025 [Bacilli bacterium]|nr:hypothetical protein [Bacilli bacterium]
MDNQVNNLGQSSSKQPVNNSNPQVAQPNGINNTIYNKPADNSSVRQVVPSSNNQPTINNNSQLTNNSTSTNINPTITNQVPPNDSDVEYEYVEQKKSYKSVLFILFLLIIIGAMGYYIYTDYQKDLKNKCSPLVTAKNEQNSLKLNSTIVKDLYQKVKTDISEDIASTDLDDSMKLYLAYRQIPDYEIYDSNCNLFNNSSMQNVTCDTGSGYTARAFKEDSLRRQVEKLFGEDTKIQNENIQLGNSCIGGYQYIKERGEYVGGQCNDTINSIYQVDKKLISAYAYNDTVVLKEKVRYYGSQDVDIDRLKNGIYVYTFKLDNNYNYNYISKEFKQK